MANSNSLIPKMIKTAFVFLTVILSFALHGQNDGKKVMTSFVPKSKAYDIYYPKSFLLNEDADGIVTISDPDSKLNMTVSSYPIEKETDDRKLIGLLNGFIKTYYKKELKDEDWNSYKTKFEILVESKFAVGETNWVWYGIVDKQRLVMFSINKATTISQEDLNLAQFMINNLLINN